MKSGADPAGYVTSLERAVKALTSRVAQLESQLPAPEQSFEADAASASSVAFRPVASTACLNTKPCLHTSASERLAHGCVSAVWTGRWAINPNSVTGRLDLQRLESVADSRNLEKQRFISADWADAACEPARPFLLSPKPHVRGHVTDATELHASQRLRGLSGKLWLMIGTSIDHFIVRYMCDHFGADRLMADAKPTVLHPAPGMHFDYCRLPSPLSLTIVYVGYKGLTALQVQANASLQQGRLSEIQALLNSTLGPSSTPDFVSFGGIEWDFKQWGLQNRQPTSGADWLGIRQSLSQQLRAVHGFWPQIRARFLRTQYRTTYHWYRGWVDVDGAHYTRYNRLMYSLTTRVEPLLCGGVHLLDIARIMNCSREPHRNATGARAAAPVARAAGSPGEEGAPGGCGRETGWTTDGLHPAQWALREYFSLALNVLADFGEACRPGNYPNGSL